MLDTLISHRASLQTFHATASDIPTEPLSIGLRLTLGIYTVILSDAISVLTSLIEFLSHEHP